MLLTIKNFFRKASSFKVIVTLVVQAEEQIVCQFPATFIVSTVYSCKSKTTCEVLCPNIVHLKSLFSSLTRKL